MHCRCRNSRSSARAIPLPAAVTTRRASPRTWRDAGLAITSGLAIGIDAAAHRGALDAAGVTVAVCGTGLDIDYPRANRALADEIAVARRARQRISARYAAAAGQLSTPQSHHQRTGTRHIGGGGGGAQRLADHGAARSRPRARGLRDSRLDPQSAGARLPPAASGRARSWWKPATISSRNCARWLAEHSRPRRATAAGRP